MGPVHRETVHAGNAGSVLQNADRLRVSRWVESQLSTPSYTYLGPVHRETVHAGNAGFVAVGSQNQSYSNITGSTRSGMD